MGDLSRSTQSQFEKVKKSFESAAVAFQSNQQSKGLQLLAEDLKHYVEAMVSSLREIMGKLNQLEIKLNILEGKLDKLEIKFDKMEDVSRKFEAKIDRIVPVGTIPPKVTVDPGSTLRDTVTFEPGVDSKVKEEEK
ncbi:MAG: hypothetical protein ACFE9S_16510 [Candidatus Hermodarchaeota archaeon]